MTLRDVAVLIVAIAPGLYLGRVFLDNYAKVFGAQPKTGWLWLSLGLMTLQTAQAGVLMLALLPPRPRLRRLARRPGFLADLAVVWVGAFQAAQALAAPVRTPRAVWINNTLLEISGSSRVASAVLLAWLIAALIGPSWRRADWVEVLGRALGLAWVIAWGAVVVARWFL
jgi:hypothetical protein